MTALESLRKRAGVLVAGGVSFALVLGVMRWSAGEKLLQPRSDLGVLIGLALVALYFVITDTRNGDNADAPKGLN